MKIVLLGPPGSGKGTQAHIICEKYNLPHISTGDIFRANIANQTELGKKAKAYMDQGSLVPDELTISIVVDRLQQPDCEKGFVFDGFPRNLAQAKELDKMVTLDKAIMIHLDDEEIINRLSKRRMCRACGNPTHMDWLVDGKCEKCGGDVYVRDDDKPEVIKLRLQKQAVPQDLIEFYKEKGVFSKINAGDQVEDTYALVKAVLDKGNND